MGEGEPEDLMINAEEALEKIIGQLDGAIETAERDLSPQSVALQTTEIEILPGFPEIVEGTYLWQSFRSRGNFPSRIEVYISLIIDLYFLQLAEFHYWREVTNS